jgi:hypothetical protein
MASQHGRQMVVHVLLGPKRYELLENLAHAARMKPSALLRQWAHEAMEARTPDAYGMAAQEDVDTCGNG